LKNIYSKRFIHSFFLRRKVDSRLVRLKLKSDLDTNSDLQIPNVRMPCRKTSCRFGSCENLLIDDKLNFTCHCVKVDNFQMKIILKYLKYKIFQIKRE